MQAILHILQFLVLLSAGASLQDVADLEGDPDFRSITLHWKYRKDGPVADGFAITYCEDQAWGKYRCKNKEIKSSEATEIKYSNSDGYRHFRTEIDGLRIATNYTVELKPLNGGAIPIMAERARALGVHLHIQTKGFVARAINCLTNTSLVEIETGPNFGGKISVEGLNDDRCAVHGDSTSPRTSYFLTIDHSICGSEQLDSSVRTFVIVQENLPILTHSTRRFMVICKYVPETFTVRAGVNLPDYNSNSDLIPVGQDISSVDPSEFLDSSNSLFSSRVGKQVGRALRLSTEKEEDPQKWGYLVLMVVLVIAAVVGLSCAVAHFVKTSRQRTRIGFMSPQVEPSAIEINENLDAMVRDFNEDMSGSDSLAALQQPPVALTTSDIVSINDQLYALTPEVGDSFPELTLRLHDVVDAELPFSPIRNDMVEYPTFILTGQHQDRLLPHGVQSVISHDYDVVGNASDISGMPSFIPVDHGLSVSVSNFENIDGIFEESYHNTFDSAQSAMSSTDSDADIINPLQYYGENQRQVIDSPPTVPEYFSTVIICDSGSELASQMSEFSDETSDDSVFSSETLSEDEEYSGHERCFDNADEGLTNEADQKFNCLSAESVGGPETNWQLMNDEGKVFPAVSV